MTGIMKRMIVEIDSCFGGASSKSESDDERIYKIIEGEYRFHGSELDMVRLLPFVFPDGAHGPRPLCIDVREVFTSWLASPYQFCRFDFKNEFGIEQYVQMIIRDDEEELFKAFMYTCRMKKRLLSRDEIEEMFGRSFVEPMPWDVFLSTYGEKAREIHARIKSEKESPDGTDSAN